jgi:hypothetical protein
VYVQLGRLQKKDTSPQQAGYQDRESKGRGAREKMTWKRKRTCWRLGRASKKFHVGQTEGAEGKICKPSFDVYIAESGDCGLAQLANARMSQAALMAPASSSMWSFIAASPLICLRDELSCVSAQELFACQLHATERRDFKAMSHWLCKHKHLVEPVKYGEESPPTAFPWKPLLSCSALLLVRHVPCSPVAPPMQTYIAVQCVHGPTRSRDMLR